MCTQTCEPGAPEQEVIILIAIFSYELDVNVFYFYWEANVMNKENMIMYFSKFPLSLYKQMQLQFDVQWLWKLLPGF